MSDNPLGARKDKRWYAVSTRPSYTKTPVGPVLVTTPYQLYCDLQQATGTSRDVRFNGSTVYLLDQSKSPMCTGDEPGRGGGCHSGTTSGEVKAAKGRESTFANGISMVCVGDLCWMNNQNTEGKIYAESAPTQTASGTKSCLVLSCSKKETCSNDVLELEAITPAENGLCSWSHSDNSYLTDFSDHRTLFGKKLKWVIKDDWTQGSPDREVWVEAVFQSSSGTTSARLTLPIHKAHPIEAVFNYFNETAGEASDWVTGQGVGAPISDYKDFKDEKLALIVIPGMNMYNAGAQENDLQNDPLLKKMRHVPTHEAESMYAACNLSFNVKRSAFIFNHTQIMHDESRDPKPDVLHPQGVAARTLFTAAKKLLPADLLTPKEIYRELENCLGFDTSHGDDSMGPLRSIYYEVFGAQDALVNATVKAILVGLKEKKEIYVVAHDQGAEIFKIALAKIRAGTEDDSHYFGKIYYQGFGPESYIQRTFSPYLANPINVKNEKDSFPTVWTVFKWAKDIAVLALSSKVPAFKFEEASHPIQKALTELLITNDPMLKILVRLAARLTVKKGVIDNANKLSVDALKDALTGQKSDVYEPPQSWFRREFVDIAKGAVGENLYDLTQQNWQTVDALLPIHYAGVIKNQHRYYFCSETQPNDYHDFLSMYWPYIRVPINWKGWPKNYAMSVADKPKLAQELPKKLLELTKLPPPPPGVLIEGRQVIVGGKPASSDQQVCIAYFVEGLAYYMKSQTNLGAMRNAVWSARKDLPTNINLWTVQDPGPGKRPIPPAQIALGKESMDIAKAIYQSLCKAYDAYYCEGYRDISIDLYGFSRGAAIVNEVAWMINQHQIRLTDRPELDYGKNIQVRFLGLFDTVHVMGDDGPNHSHQWNNIYIAGCVQHFAHALAEDERRLFYAPTIFRRDPKQTTEFGQVSFPGIHTDIGGGTTRNPLISKLTLSWMATQATRAGVPYLKKLMLPPAEEEELKRDPRVYEPGKKDYPNDTYIRNGGWFFWEAEKRTIIANMTPDERIASIQPQSSVTNISAGSVTANSEGKDREVLHQRSLRGVDSYIS